MENFKPIYDMTPEEIEESNRKAIEKQQELLQKMENLRAERKATANKETDDKSSN